MGGFDYNTIDTSKVKDVEIVSGQISQTNQNSTGSSDQLTQEQKRKQSLVEYLSEDFKQFHDLFDELIASYRSYGRRNEFVAETIGVPDYSKCRNCSRLGESPDGNSICLSSGIEKDGKTLYKIIENEDSIPSFCSTDMRTFEFPENLLDEVNREIRNIAEDGYEEYVTEQRETHKRRREEMIERGREDSEYVTKDLDAFVKSRTKYVAGELTKLTRSLFDPRDLDDFRTSALHLAWMLCLDDILQEDYYSQRAEAYLRTLDSEHQTNTAPGAGGDKFEEDVRDFIREIGWPIRDRLFRIDGNTKAQKKEMDIHTEIAGEPTIIEVYTTGSHGSKREQVSDYQELYKIATGNTARPVHLTDSYANYQLSIEFLRTLLNLSPVDVDAIPGEHRQFETEMDRFTPEKIGEASDYTYEFQDFSYSPPDDCISLEQSVERMFESRGLNVTKPYSESEMWTYAVGPTVTLDSDIGLDTIAFHGGRDEKTETDKKPAKHTNDVVAAAANWPSWLSSVMDKQRVTAVRVADRDIQNILSPRLLYSLLQFQPDSMQSTD